MANRIRPARTITPLAALMTAPFRLFTPTVVPRDRVDDNDKGEGDPLRFLREGSIPDQAKPHPRWTHQRVRNDRMMIEFPYPTADNPLVEGSQPQERRGVLLKPSWTPGWRTTTSNGSTPSSICIDLVYRLPRHCCVGGSPGVRERSARASIR